MSQQTTAEELTIIKESHMKKPMKAGVRKNLAANAIKSKMAKSQKAKRSAAGIKPSGGRNAQLVRKVAAKRRMKKGGTTKK